MATLKTDGESKDFDEDRYTSWPYAVREMPAVDQISNLVNALGEDAGLIQGVQLEHLNETRGYVARVEGGSFWVQNKPTGRRCIKVSILLEASDD